MYLHTLQLHSNIVAFGRHDKNRKPPHTFQNKNAFALFLQSKVPGYVNNRCWFSDTELPLLVIPHLESCTIKKQSG